MSQPAESSASRSGTALVYVAIVLGALVIALDFASVDLALPSMESQFGLNFNGVQWVINSYILAFSVLMVAGGKFADAYGRKRVFLLGMSIFTLASFLGGFAWDGASLIGFRVLQGVGAAFLWPAMIGMACEAVGPARQSLALGIVFGTCSLGNAAGPVVGGALTEWFSWRWVLWINVPLALACLAATVWGVAREKKAAERPRNDFPGMLSLTGGLVALMLFVYQGQDWGWMDARTIGFLVVAVALLAAFPFIERCSADPLVALDLIRNKEIATLCFCVMVICQLFFVVLLYFTQYALKFLGDDPVAAGARVVQFMLVYGAVSYFGGPISRFFGRKRLLVLGFSFAIAGTALLAVAGPGASWLPFNLGLVLLGFGVGAVIPTVSACAIDTVGTERASLVSGITFMCQLAGSAVMLAVNAALFNAFSGGTLNRLVHEGGLVLTSAQSAAAEAVLSGALTVRRLPAGATSDAGIDTAELSSLLATAYLHGLQVVLWLAVALAVVALLLVLRYVSSRRPVETTTPTP